MFGLILPVSLHWHLRGFLEGNLAYSVQLPVCNGSPRRPTCMQDMVQLSPHKVQFSPTSTSSILAILSLHCCGLDRAVMAMGSLESRNPLLTGCHDWFLSCLCSVQWSGCTGVQYSAGKWVHWCTVQCREVGALVYSAVQCSATKCVHWCTVKSDQCSTVQLWCKTVQWTGVNQCPLDPSLGHKGAARGSPSPHTGLRLPVPLYQTVTNITKSHSHTCHNISNTVSIETYEMSESEAIMVLWMWHKMSLRITNVLNTVSNIYQVLFEKLFLYLILW